MLNLTVTAALVLVFVASRLIKYRSDVNKVSHLPGLRCLFHPIGAIGSLLPHSRINPGTTWQWHWRNQIYQCFRSRTMSVVGLLSGEPMIFTTSMEVARQFVSTRGMTEKSPLSILFLAEWGPNVFTTNGDVWRRHRRIIGSAFNGNIYNLVWRETAALFDEMVEVEQWENKPIVVVDPVNELTTKFGLSIMSRCAFGNSIPWNQEQDVSEMSFAEAMMIVSQAPLIRYITPKWMYKLPFKFLSKIDRAHKIVRAYTKSLAQSRKTGRLEDPALSDSSQTHQDLFDYIAGCNLEDGVSAMTDEELISNTFLILFAGHETTAHTLSATIGMLALYQDVQEEIWEEIQFVASEDPDLSFESCNKLSKTQGAFLEAGRLFPAVFIMLRRATEDLVLNTDDPDISSGRLIIHQGTTLAVDMVGMHHDPTYFPDPEEFRPSRWYDARENQMSMFSFGPRACVGRRFALTQAICFMARLLRKWRIEPMLKVGESPSEWRRRVMVPHMFITMGVADVPVRLLARKEKST